MTGFVSLFFTGDEEEFFITEEVGTQESGPSHDIGDPGPSTPTDPNPYIPGS
ncbi:hypothetical protein [Natranaerobius thermophilus]|uniref:Uncharacterized protein n=1 Tax=Natranaerobius thermophilus (strain ATCC BAA-1301 / DSM 18059 / JW/NM-WN-LF) TaxID=457570 RepID=B2A286_NATTJ|nr:hypothetical protein [Natranaerobius thermophilus]ACB86194.1 hypothetical protein Nther_2639 [Natranaerobius thermophilus JW/NM-WN-LF]